MTNSDLHVAIAIVRARRLLQSEPRLVPLHVRERLHRALELAKGDFEYASKLVDVRV
jgi:hypothetical protein